ncbi:MAG: response regulator [Rickettsiales bacterium]|nr:response regulator [Rickettsiales bacterium]
MSTDPRKLYNILIADPDQQLGQVLRMVLREMGFENINVTRSGQDAVRLLSTNPTDFLITEWSTLHLDGLSLIKHIRRNPDSPNPVLPIIMLTGRAEVADVHLARDHGINEYVVKPFSPKTIYSRLERIIERPRPFVISNEFVGPDRRHKGTPPEGVSDRRVRSIKPQQAPADVHGQNLPGNEPRIWLPDYSLKQKLGQNKTIQQFITNDLLNQAQQAIDAITDESLTWIKENLTELNALSIQMAQGDATADLVNQLCDLALTVNARAGTFGYTRASEVAYMLYLFCRNQLDPQRNSIHQAIIQKHIDVLRVLFAKNMRGIAGAAGAEIVTELQKLVGKYST